MSNNKDWQNQEKDSTSPLAFLVWFVKPIGWLGKLLFTNYTPRKKVWLLFIGIIILTILASLVALPQSPSWVPASSFWSQFKVHLGLDLQGGSHLEYQADVREIKPGEEASALDGVKDVIERRINPSGVAETLVQTSKVGNSWRVIVELPGEQDITQAIKLIGETPILEFREEGDIGVATPEKEITKTKAEDILTLALKPGTDFAALAKEHSEDDGSKDKGGDLDWFREGLMVKPFEDAVKALAVNQISKNLVESEFGWHIIKKTGDRYVTENGKKILELRASHILIKVPIDPYGNWIYTGLSGQQLKRAQVEFDPNTGVPQVGLTFNDEGKKLFAEITGRNIGKPVAIYLDGTPISKPTVQEAIAGGQAVISGDFTLTEAKQLAQRLNAGALPVPIKLVGQQTVDATLGKASLNKSLLAGLAGLLAVVLFMLIFYRLPGLLSVLALGIYSAITFAVFKLWPVTLSIGGVAGFVLSIGMAVDANILIFERIKEELRWRKPLSQAIEEGFKRAWTSIRDSNVSSLITSVILIFLGSTLVKGFAITLVIGILISMFSAVTVTRTFLRLLSGEWFSRKLFLYGVKIDKTAEVDKV